MTSIRAPRLWWSLGAAAITLLIATGAAVIIAPDGRFAFGVESASSATTALIRRPNVLFPGMYAVFAGLVAAFNPCGFALLPGYLGLYLRSGDRRQDRMVTIVRPALVALAVAVAFVTVFGLVGLAVSLAGAAVSGLFPWIGLVIGVLLIAGGAAMVGGWTPLGFGQPLVDRLGQPASRRGMSGYFAYGVAYALASLGCALPVFLSVIATTLLVRGWFGELIQFFLYAIGMSLSLAVLTVGAAIFKAGLVNRISKLARIFEPLSAGLLLLVGAYVVYYWLTLGGLLQV